LGQGGGGQDGGAGAGSITVLSGSRIDIASAFRKSNKKEWLSADLFSRRVAPVHRL
jgi:hypothetical protein